jgi:hypothetical protein
MLPIDKKKTYVAKHNKIKKTVTLCIYITMIKQILAKQ